MSIPQTKDKIKGLSEARRESALMAAIMVLIAGGAFGLGILFERDKAKAMTPLDSPVVIEGNVPFYTGSSSSKNSQEASSSLGTPGGAYVASRNGTKYYPVGCSAANRINEENKIYFLSTGEAEAAGLTASTSCGSS